MEGPKSKETISKITFWITIASIVMTAVVMHPGVASLFVIITNAILLFISRWIALSSRS